MSSEYETLKIKYDSLVESLILAKQQRDQFKVECNKLEAECERLRIELGERGAEAMVKAAIDRGMGQVYLPTARDVLRDERDRYKAALERIANEKILPPHDYVAEQFKEWARQALDGGNVAECVCGEINARNCPVHQ